jgi:site-specific recombinase XerD
MNTNLPQTTDQRALVTDVTSLIEDWLDYATAADDLAPATIRAYRRGMGHFSDWLQETGNRGTVTPRVVLDWKGDLLSEYAPQTVNLRLSAVRSFYRWAVATERLATSPAASVRGAKRPNSQRHKRDPLSSSEVVAVLQTCDPGTLQGNRDRAILALMAYCGLRTVEIKRANVGNLKTEGERLVLEVQGKGRREADDIVVIPTSQEHVIRDWHAHRVTLRDHGSEDPLFVSLSNRNRGDRLTTRAIRAMVRDRFDAAGVVGRRKSAHSLRHSAITSAIRHGAKPMQVQQMARHESFDTTLGYYHEEGRTADPAEDYVRYE